jgi:hypothetical protein
MTETATLDSAPQPQPGLFARAIGIVTSPKATYQAVVRKPNTVAILALVAFLVGGSQSAMNLTERGRQASVDFSVSQMEKFGVTVTDQMYEQMVARQKYAVYTSFVGAFIGFPLVILLLSAILYAVFNAIMGGTGEFKQVMAIVSHASVISALGAIFAAVINYSRGSISTSVANLGMLLPMLPEKSFAANLAGGIDVFQIWWIITLSIGLGVLYKRKTSSIATSLFVVYGLIIVCVSYFFSKG